MQFQEILQQLWSDSIGLRSIFYLITPTESTYDMNCSWNAIILINLQTKRFHLLSVQFEMFKQILYLVE
jgi:hypothetical protein